MKKDARSMVVVAVFLALVIGSGLLLLHVVWPSNPGQMKAAVVEGTIEELEYPQDSPGYFIIKCDKFHDVYRTYRFTYRIYEDTEVLWGDNSLPVSELAIGDVVQIRGFGAQPNPVGTNAPVGFSTFEKRVVLLERGRIK